MTHNPNDPAAADHGLTDVEAEATADASAPAEEFGAEPSVDAQVTDATEVDGDLDANPSAEDALRAELAERTEDLQRVSAEYANYRRRTDKERVATRDAAKADVVTQLLPIFDDLALAESHGDLSGPLKAVADKLNSVLAGAKVEPFGAEGDEFNPEIHEAVQDLSSGEDKAVGTVLRRGYRLNDRILRTALVIIADRG